jgi:hypothetical protein
VIHIREENPIVNADVPNVLAVVLAVKQVILKAGIHVER